MIDIIYFILIALAIYKGYSKGLILAIFSVIAFVIGLSAALKLSTTVATYFSTQSNMAKWMPAISFFIVFVATAFAVKFVGNLIQKMFETLLLGWVNRIAGIVLYALLYSIIFSVALFYMVQLHFFDDKAISASIVYPYLQPLGPKVINGFGVVIPWFKNMFSTLETFFGKFAK